MFTSLRARLWLSYVLLAGIMILVIGATLIAYLLRNPSETRAELQRLRLAAAYLQERIGPFSTSLNNAPGQDLLPVLEQADEQLHARILLTDAQGRLLLDSRRGSAPGLNGLTRALNRRIRLVPYLVDNQGGTWLFVSRPLGNGAYVSLAEPHQRVPFLAVFRDEFFRPIVGAISIALLLSLLLAYGIARWIATPLQRMAVAAQKLSLSTHPFHPELLPIEGPEEVQILGSAFNDMTRRVYASQAAQQDLVANVSHDLKTPLTSIQGFAQAILDGTIDNPESFQQAAGVIYDESGRMYRMVAELLDLARLEAGVIKIVLERIAIGDLLDRVITKFMPLASEADKHLEKDWSILPEIIGDSDRLSQLFTNLVDNALKFTPRGGKVIVSSRSVRPWLEISVEDSGPGITPGEQDRIFERFYQTDKSRPGGIERGSGLGLAISRQIVIAHNGEIYVQNLPAGGAIFTVKLPMGRVEQVQS